MAIIFHFFDFAIDTPTGWLRIAHADIASGDADPAARSDAPVPAREV